MSLLMAAALLAGIVALPVSLHAQFQPPTDEELKMTAEPNAPGAAAIYLYREESSDDNINFQKLTVRIKVLTEKGKELATVSAPYLKREFNITDIKGRTIHSDGTIYPLTVKPEDLTVNKTDSFQFNKKVFTLPNVEVGSILEYTLELRYGENWAVSPVWEVQQDYYVRKEHFTFVKTRKFGGYTLYTPYLPSGAKIQEDQLGRFTLDIADVPAAPNEEYMPPPQALRYRVAFHYSGYSTEDDFWKYQGETWSKDVNRFADADKPLAEAARGLVAGADTDEAKARKLYDAVMALDNTDFSRRKSTSELKDLGLRQAKKAQDIWNQKSGASDEIALLYLSMLRAVGIKAYAMAVTSREQAIFDPNTLSFGQFRSDNDPVEEVVIIATLNGKEVFLDPAERYTTFGQLHWKHNLAGGIRQSEKGTELGATPANIYKDASVTRTANLTVAEDGSVTGTARIALNGPEALRWRQRAIVDDPDEVKKQFNAWLESVAPEGVHAELDHFLGLADYNSVLMAVVRVSGQLGTTTGKRMFLPYSFFASRAAHPFVADAHRTTAVDMHYADIVHDEVSYTLPDGYSVETLPADATSSWPAHAILKFAAQTDPNSITVNRTLARAFVLVTVDYDQLHDFYQKVATADQQQVVLTRVPQK
jgi:hypothetical protein